jgi:hypothetical protein
MSEWETFTPTTIKHGTYGGYQRCRLQPGGACDACRAASRAYARERRVKVGLDYEKRYERARRHALAVLAERHRAESYELMSAEKKREGL